ncbi:GGDEF domain-containing protein [Catenovulum sp. SM1970]|uniref:GGDEF domain-containing protein n=1 Tax=Marinifaba aquimaris TaxID=2741323 RepID=UPI0015716602|nr:GGDEF domain-containing protein [Marinifaba aquimaris]NTS76940.1 GGDEF domain-containing protein [Marinifaba aquimaris]
MANQRSLELTLNKILSSKSIRTLFHPIYNLQHNTILGYEALSRGPHGSELEFADTLFGFAHKQNQRMELECLCVERALANATRLNLPGKIFVNISPSTLIKCFHDKYDLQTLLRRYQVSGHQLVIELIEVNPAKDLNQLKYHMDEIRSLGVQFAIDDLGSGNSGLIQWAILQPEFCKIDRFFIKNCIDDPVKKAFLRSFQKIGEDTQTEIIAEGIETEHELHLVQQLNITQVQGYLMSMPSETPSTDNIQIESNQTSYIQKPLLEETVAQLLERNLAVQKNLTTQQVMSLFRDNKALHVIPVLDGEKPVGVALRADMMEHFAMPFGHALYDNKPIESLMRKDIIVVDKDVSLDDLSKMVTETQREDIRAHFVISDNDKYLGIGSVKMLLKRITDTKIQHAKYANPLTLLPGNVPIDKEIDSLLRQRHGFHLAYLDLDNFKPFNDLYGYSKGDQAIQLVADLLKQHCPSKSTSIGHIGGDDFVIIYREENWHQMLLKLLADFDEKVKNLLYPQHLKDGGYWATNRSGQRDFFPILSLSAGVVWASIANCQSHHDVASLATQAKKEAKKRLGSSIYLHCEQTNLDEGKRVVEQFTQPANANCALSLATS